MNPRTWKETNLLVVRNGEIGEGRKKILEKNFEKKGAKVVSFSQRSFGYKKRRWPVELSVVVADPPKKAKVMPILEQYFNEIPSTVKIQSPSIRAGQIGPKWEVDVEANEEEEENVHSSEEKGGKTSIEGESTEVELEDFFKGGKRSYICQRSAMVDHKNKELVSMFKQMTEYESVNLEQNVHEMKATMYQKAGAVLRAWPVEIQTNAQANLLKKVPLIGESTLSKIKEGLQELSLGREASCKKLRHLQGNEKLKVLKTFVTVHGIGATTADQAYRIGLRSLNDLRLHLDKGNDLSSPMKANNSPGKARLHLNNFTKLFLKYYDDVTQPFKRQDVDLIMRKYIIPVLTKNKLHYEIVGGYRRGKDGGHDLDILITTSIPSQVGHEKGYRVVNADEWNRIEQEAKDMRSIAERVVQDLEDFILERERTQFRGDTSKSLVALLLCRFEKLVRRVDLVFVPSYQWPYSLLGWSGSQVFQKSIRQFSKLIKDEYVAQFPSYSWNLSSNSLSLKPPTSKNTANNVNDYAVKYVLCYTEQDIFSFLGLDYLPPEHRCH